MDFNFIGPMPGIEGIRCKGAEFHGPGKHHTKKQQPRPYKGFCGPMPEKIKVMPVYDKLRYCWVGRSAEK